MTAGAGACPEPGVLGALHEIKDEVKGLREDVRDFAVRLGRVEERDELEQKRAVIIWQRVAVIAAATVGLLGLILPHLHWR